MTATRPIILTLELNPDAFVIARDQDDTEVTSISEMSAHDLEAFLNDRKKPVEARLADERKYREFGRKLFEVLLHGPVHGLYIALSQRARSLGVPLYIRLVLDPRWQQYPWEMLFDEAEQEFLALTPGKALYRVVRPQTMPNLLVPSIHAAIISATPSDLVNLDTEAEQAKLRQALAVEGDSLPNLTVHHGIDRGLLNKVLDRHRPGILHFMGHGRYFPPDGEGALAFHDAEGNLDWVRERELADMLRGHERLGLVVLTACESARSNPRDAFSGVGARLVEARVPAVVALQYEFQDKSAPIFTHALYSGLARGDDVAVATQAARRQLKAERPDAPREPFAPVLYMRGAPLRLRSPAESRQPRMTADMDAFVEPANFKALALRLEQDNALLLSGPPGSGKTLIARMLQYHFRTRTIPYEVRSARSPAAIREGLEEDGPILFHVDDPWGMDAVDIQAGWRTHLPGLIRQLTAAGKGAPHKLLVTTRDANLHEVYRPEVPPELRNVSTELTYDAYDREARAAILRNKARSLSAEQRHFVEKHEKAVVDGLRAPLSIDHFIFSVKEMPQEPAPTLKQLLHSADVKRLGTILLQELDERDWAKPPAIFLWTQLCVLPVFILDTTREHARLLTLPSGEPLQVQKLTDWMLGAGWLKEDEGGYRAHPTTVSGLEQLLTTEPDVADVLIGEYLGHLCAREETERALQIAERFPDARREALPAAVRSSIRQYLTSLLTLADAQAFTRGLYAAQRWLDDKSPVALLVHALLAAAAPKNKRGWSFPLLDWEPPAWPPHIRDAIQASGDARRVLEQYIRFELLYCDLLLLKAFADWTWTLGWDLTQCYREALGEALNQYSSASEGLVHGILGGRRPPDEEVLSLILDALDSLGDSDDAGDDERLWQARQGFLDDAYAEHIFQGRGDDHYAVESALRTCVQRRRERQGHRWMLKHPRRERLLSAWGSVLEEVRSVPDKEFWDFVDAASAAAPELVWKMLRLRAQRASVAEAPPAALVPPPPGILPKVLGTLRKALSPLHLFGEGAPPHGEVRLAARIAGALGSAPSKHLTSSLDTLAVLLSPEEVRAALAKASASWPDERRVAVAVAATRIQVLSSNASQAQYVEAVRDAMGGQLRGVIDACLRAMAGDAGSGTASPLTQGEIDRLRHWVRHPEEELGRVCLLALAVTGASVVDEARSALLHEDEDARTTAVRALRYDSSAPARALLQGALANANAHVRAAAIEALSRGATPQERDAILALAQDRSRYVRGACIEAIRRERWEQGIGVLIRLLRDSYDAGPGMGEESVDHELASSAAKLLSEWTPPSSEWIPQFLQFVQDGLDANPDLSVHEAVLTMLEGFDDPRVAQGLSRRLERTRRKQHRLEGTLERAVLQTLSRHLVHSPRYATEVSIQAIITHVQNLEPGHAGIALIILGMLGQRAEAALSQLLVHEDYRAERALLCLFGSIFVQGPRSAAAQKAVEQNALAKQLYGWAEGAPVDAPEIWKERWRAHPALHAQLTAMREDEDGWPGFLASLLPALFGESFRQGLG